MNLLGSWCLRTMCAVTVIAAFTTAPSARGNCIGAKYDTYKKITTDKNEISSAIANDISNGCICASVVAGDWVLYDGVYFVLPKSTEILTENIEYADANIIKGKTFMLFPIENKFFNFASEKWDKLYPPNRIPDNVTDGAVWVPGPNGSEAYIKIISQMNGSIELNVFTDFRKFNGNMYHSGAMYADREKFYLIPRSDKIVSEADIKSFIWPATFIMNDGSIMQRGQLIDKMCSGDGKDRQINKFLFSIACLKDIK